MLALSIATILNRRGPAAAAPTVFSPSELFANSEVGVWYDPSDLSTLYQDTSGTTPVTAVEQPVGLMLDKSNTSTDNPDDSTGWTNVNTTFDTFTDDGNGGFTAEKTTAGGTDSANTTDTFNVAVGEWYKFSINVTATTLTSYGVQVASGSNGRSTSAVFSGTGVKTGYLRVTNVQAGAQLSIATSSIGSITVASAHWERVLGHPAVAANNGTARPVLKSAGGLYYLAFTTDDAMSTASIDFSGSDEMSVFAGVTKNSDAASGFLAELSANVDNNNGTFFLLTPSNNGANSYRYGSKGTVFAAAGTGVFVAAPDTAVLSGLSDISGDTATLRRNGSVVETSTADQGTGNFGNYPLYIGARGGSSLFFNGSLYSLIVRGKTSTAQEIDDTEAWVADKTGVTL